MSDYILGTPTAVFCMEVAARKHKGSLPSESEKIGLLSMSEALVHSLPSNRGRWFPGNRELKHRTNNCLSHLSLGNSDNLSFYWYTCIASFT